MTGKKNACGSLKLLQADFATFAIAAIRAAQSLLVMPRISAQPLSTANKIWCWRARMAGVLLLLGMPLLATAQQATVIGTITDPSNAIIVDVKVTLTNLETGLSNATTTNADGQYVVPNLQIGHYAIKAEAKGFKVAEQKGIVLEVGDRRRVDFHMELGGTAESVTVESTLPVAVQTDTNEISDVITGNQLAQLGTNGRSFYSLAKLVPGASSSQVDFQNPTPMGGDSNISFNGNRSMHALYMIDGGETDDRGGAQGSIVIPSQDSLAEFRVMTSNYSAEYGLSSGATITSAIKGGTKQVHASAWWFGRNDFLNARNFFNPAENANGTLNKQAELRFNVWGFNVGGPVEFKRTNNPKTFFFYNMEWRRLIQPGRNFNQLVPITSTYTGNLNAAIAQSGLFSSAGLHTPCSNAVSTTVANNFAAAGVPLSTCDASGNVLTAAAFPNNTIPSSLLDPNGQALLKAGIFPAPNAGDAFVGATAAPTSVKEEIARVDHTFNDKFSIFGHWISEQVAQTDIPTRWSGDNVPTAADTFGNPSYSAVVHVTHIIRPTLLNEIGFNYDGNRINMLPSAIYKLSQAPGFTQNKLFSFPTNVLPVIELSGNTTAQFNNNWNPWINTANDYQLKDDVSWTKGSHQFKFGGSWANFRKAQPLQTGTEGHFHFNGSFTGYDFADMLLGLAQGYDESALKDTRHWNSVSWGAYGQDNWRATRRLTLNLGLRWDGIPHTAEINGQMANFYPNLWNPANAAILTGSSFNQICSGPGTPNASCTGASPTLAPGLNPAFNGYLFYTNGLGVPNKTPGVTNSLVANHWDTFGPRVGFAYDITGDGKTVLRGGFGTFYERIQGNDMYQSAGFENLFNANVTLNNVSLSNPHIGVDASNAQISPATLPVLVTDQTALDSRHYNIPTTYQYSMGVQRQLGARSVLSVSYVGNEGHFESFAQETNLPPFSQLASVTGANYRDLLPYRGYRVLLTYQDGENSHYNSLQMELHSQFHGLQLQAAYTYARAVDATQDAQDGGDLNNVTNPYVGWRYDVGPAAINRRNVAFVNFIYDLPIFRGASNRLLKGTLGGWQVSGIITAESGLPLNLTVSGNTICSTVQNCAVRPDLNGSVSYPKARTTSQNGNGTIQWFSPASFSTALLSGTSTPTFGNAPHNAIWGPGRQDWDLSVFKTFAPSERLHFELRGESYNSFNHTQFQNLDLGLGDANFGRATSAYDPRVFQLGAKAIF